ncbi:MAG: hypothetical protein KC586_22315 [Myxococcales bacterium]|nr:hypothetical protein [Myxococcales bacterium]
MLRLIPLVLVFACAGGGGTDTDRRDARVPDAADGGRVDAGDRDGGRRDGGAIVPDDAGNCPSGLTRCGGACVDTDTEPTSCGACGRTCVITNAEPSCAAGECTLGTCRDGFADCDGNLANGCEATDSCVAGGSCTTICGTMGTQTCADRCAPTCAPPAELCNARDDDCDGDCAAEGSLPGCRAGVHRGSGPGHVYSRDVNVTRTNGYTTETENYFYVYAGPGEGLAGLYRCLKGNGLFFLTLDPGCEGQTLAEMMGFVARDARCGGTPLFRMYRDGNHFYTTSAAERDGAITTYGYTLESTLGYVW